MVVGFVDGDFNSGSESSRKRKVEGLLTYQEEVSRPFDHLFPQTLRPKLIDKKGLRGGTFNLDLQLFTHNISNFSG